MQGESGQTVNMAAFSGKLLLVWALSLVIMAASFAGDSLAQTFAIRSANVFDGRTGEASLAFNIIIEDGVIQSLGPTSRVAIPENMSVLDGTDKWVMPGLIDVHVHNSDPAYLQKMLAMGVTSIHLMPNHPPDSPTAFTAHSNDPHHRSPRVHMSLMFTRSFPDNLFPGVYEFQKPLSVTEARDQVRMAAEQGYKSIKIIDDDSVLWAGPETLAPRFTADVFNELVEEARRHNMRVYIHATQVEVTRQAVVGDALLHGTMDMTGDEALWLAMRQSGTVWAPTSSVLLLFGDFGRYAKLLLSDPLLAATLTAPERTQFENWARSPTPLFAPNSEVLNANLEKYLGVIARNTRLALDHHIPVAVGTDGGRVMIESGV